MHTDRVQQPILCRRAATLRADADPYGTMQCDSPGRAGLRTRILAMTRVRSLAIPGGC